MSEHQMLSFDTALFSDINKAKEEAERLGIIMISDIILLKVLMYDTESYTSDMFSFMGLPWKKVKNAIESVTDEWVQEQKNYESKIIQEYGEPEESFGEQEDGSYTFSFDQNLATILRKAIDYQYSDKPIDEISIMLAILDNASNPIVEFFKLIGLDSIIVMRYFEGLQFEVHAGEYYDEIRSQLEIESSAEKEDNHIDYKEFKDEFIIPKNLQSFVKVLKADTSDTSPILGREEETEKLVKVLLKAKKSNAILVGRPGVGKTAIIEHLAWLIANDKCIDALKGKTILSLEVNDIIAGTTLRGMAEERFKAVSDLLENTDNIILFIDEIHNVIGAGNSGSDDKLDFANALKPILARENVAVVGATTDAEYERIFRKDGAFKRRFEKIEIREPKAREVYSMVKEQINKLSSYHGVTITKSVVDFIINVSGCLNFETSNPDRTLDLIDKSMATAKLLGEDLVTKSIVLNNFDANFKLYLKLSEEYKLSIAYHEAGHYLVARYGKTHSTKALAVSIIPYDDYMGVTLCDDEPNYIDWDYQAYINSIAITLAGRVAEKMYSGKDTSGANSDLRKATELARKMVVEYGFSSTFARRNSEKDFNDVRVDKLNSEIDKIILEAYNLAQIILKEHESTLNELAKALVKKGMLVENELDKICKKFEGKEVVIKEPDIFPNK